MQNLKKPTQKILINSATELQKFTLYQDSIRKQKILNLLPFGVELYGDGASYTNGVLSAPVASGTLNANIQVAVTCNEDGVKQIEEIALNTQTNCLVDCYYEPSFQLIKKVQWPGNNNNEDNWTNRISYTAKLDTSSTTNFTSATGIITAAGINSLVDQFVSNIYWHQGYFTSNNNPITNNSASYVDVYKAYRWSNTAWGSATITIDMTLPDGTAAFAQQTIADGATSKATAEVVNANATLNDYVEAFQVTSGNGEIVIKSKVSGAKLTIAIGTASTSTLSDPSLIVVSKSDDVQYDLVIDANQWTKERYSLATISATTSAGTTTTVTNLGVSAAVSDDAAEVTHTGNLNGVYTGALSGHVLATGGDNVSLVYADEDVTSLKFRFSELSTSVASITSYIPRWEVLPYEEIRNTFVNSLHSGMLMKFENQNLPVVGTDYCRVFIKVDGLRTFSMHNDSGYMHESQLVELYIPKSIAHSNLFAISGTKIIAGSVLSLVDVFGIWAGNDVAEFIQDAVAEVYPNDTLTYVFNDTDAAGGPGILTIVINGNIYASAIADGSATTAVLAMKTVLDAAGFTTTNVDDPGVKNTFTVISPNPILTHSSAIATSTGIAITSVTLS